MPHHPGYGESPRPDWVMNVRDIAVIYRSMLGKLGLVVRVIEIDSDL